MKAMSAKELSALIPINGEPLRAATLERELKAGGILFENPEGVPAFTLRHANRAWRQLMSGLARMSREAGDDLLAELGVVRTYTGNGAHYMMM